MNVILTKPYKIGSKIHPKGKEIDLESNTAKRMILNKLAKKPGFVYETKKRIKKQLNKK